VVKIYRINKTRVVTKEEKAVAKIATIMSDFSLDLEAVGKYLAISTPYIVYRRALEVLEAMEFNKQVVEYNQQQGYYDEQLF
jgi:hypothetical protein